MRVEAGRTGLIALAVVCAWFVFVGNAWAFQSGDILASTGAGIVKEFSPSGTLVATYDTGTGAVNTAGSAFDPAGNFYVTDFGSQSVTKFTGAGSLVGPFGSGYNADPESITFDAAGNAYVGQADGSGAILKFDHTGTLVSSFSPLREDRGTDWLALAPDGCTMYYTSEGTAVKRFNVCTDEQLTDFIDGLPGSNAYEIRLLPHGAGVLVADSQYVVRLDASGHIVQTYQSAGHTELFAAEVAPDGSEFWAGDLNTGEVIAFSLTSGSIITEFNTSSASGLGGLTVVGGSQVVSGSTYVALGDSFSAGEGNTPFLSGTDTGRDKCHRSTFSYPFNINLDLGFFAPNFSFHACSGARIKEFYQENQGNHEPPQLSWLKAAGARTKLVTLTIGGNDAYFAQVIQSCWEASFLHLPSQSCVRQWNAPMESAIQLMGSNVPGNHQSLAQLYDEIAKDAPNAQVIVLGYPRFFPANPPLLCGTGGGNDFDRAQMTWLNEKVAEGDRAIGAAVRAAGNSRVHYISGSYEAFRGHERCEKEPYYYGIRIGFPVGSFHPTMGGQRRLAELVERAYHQ
jgi:GDSL-like Lipase/Acylhydrolase family